MIMHSNSSFFDSEYIIDGIRCDCTPGQMLKEAMAYTAAAEGERSGLAPGTVVDETSDRIPAQTKYDENRIYSYLKLVLDSGLSGKRKFPILYPDVFTRQRIAVTLLEAIWKKGHFTLENIVLSASWEWDPEPVGNMAAFYSSVGAASEYICGLGTALQEYSCSEVKGACSADFSVYGLIPSGEDDLTGISISAERACPEEAVADSRSWIIYIPFDQCSFRLGGSVLSGILGSGGMAPEICDPDYFIDCYEVVRELVEDRVVIAGTTVCDGGLAAAAARMARTTGIPLDLSGIMTAYHENDITRILFSEIPGVIVQIDDNDYDYIDAQLLLQDIAYYPLGHPSPSSEGIEVMRKGRSGVADILAALMQGTPPAGED